MPSFNRAVIDIGTNSVKLLVAEIRNGSVLPLHESTEQTRLGRGFYTTRRLLPEAIRETARAAAHFAETAAQWNPASIRVIATSATRDALNQDELIQAVQSASGLPVQVISGEQEAEWAFLGVTSDPDFARSPLLLVELGGGSAEFILGQHHQRFFRQSFPLGTVRLLEQFPPCDPPAPGDWTRQRAWVADFLQQEVRPRLSPALQPFPPRSVQLAGAGGTPGILARIQLALPAFDRARIDSSVLTLDQIRFQRARLWSLPLEPRRQVVGLPPNRADVILAGITIFEAIMDQFDFPTLRPSSRGLRYAALLEPPCGI